MKIVLSRKGFDSGYGGYPSPILPDGRLVSFPIPDKNGTIKYNELYINERTSFSQLIHDLIGDKIKIEGIGKVPIDNLGCHLDPDVDPRIYHRFENWKGLFGQAGAAQGHLSNNNISKGDIFLFFGWFRQVEIINGKYRYSKSDKNGKHVIYGYMEVGQIRRVNGNKFEEWMLYHPHLSDERKAYDSNHIYIANDILTHDPSIRGFGTFFYNKNNQLTKEGLSKSKWCIPDFFKETRISYHSEKSWKNGYFQSAAKGQEFVVEGTPDIEKWVHKLIKTSI